MKKVMILAGAGQIGMAIARRMGTGMKIIIGDKKLQNAEMIADIMNKAGFDVAPIEMDLSSRDSIKNIIAQGILTLELNSGQMLEDVKLAVNCNIPVHFYSRQGGMLPTQQAIFDKLNLEFNLNLKEGL